MFDSSSLKLSVFGRVKKEGKDRKKGNPTMSSTKKKLWYYQYF